LLSGVAFTVCSGNEGKQQDEVKGQAEWRLPPPSKQGGTRKTGFAGSRNSLLVGASWRAVVSLSISALGIAQQGLAAQLQSFGHRDAGPCGACPRAQLNGVSLYRACLNEEVLPTVVLFFQAIPVSLFLLFVSDLFS